MSRKTRRAAQSAANSVESAQIKLLESITSFYDDYIDPRDDDVDPVTGERWLGIGAGGKDAQERRGVPQTEQDLAQAREECRLLAATNEFAINGHENRISYIVGSGHSYDVQWKEGEEPEEEEPEPNAEPMTEAEDDADGLDAIRAALDRFIEANCWQQRQQEIVRRKDRDGECFLRLFVGEDGTTRVRFVEPVQIAQPVGNDKDTFGIKTDAKDVETVEGYWIDGELVPAEEVQHRKANVDANVKRGVPLLWPVRKNLRRAERLLRNMSVVGEIQTAIAIIRKHQGGTKAGVEQFVSGKTDVSVTNQATGKTANFRRYAPGTILDTNVGMEYEFPAAGLDAGRYVQVLQAELRAIASRLVMPEFMLSSDASNANYSSTMVAEGPAVKMFQRLQFDMIEDDLVILRKALVTAGIAKDLLDRVEIIAQPPNIQSRDRLKDAQADFILQKAGAISSQTIAERNDLDWDVEKQRIGTAISVAPLTDIPGASITDTPDPLANEPERQPAVGSQGTAVVATAQQPIQTTQDLVLNGAQIQAALSIVTAVAKGDMPRDAGIGQLQVLFNLAPQQAEQIMGSAGTSTPTTPNPKPNVNPEPLQAISVPTTEGERLRLAAQLLWEGYP